MVEVEFGKLKDQNKSMPEAIVPPANRIPTISPLPAYTMVQPYAVVTIDLTTARTVVSLGSITLPDGTTLINWIANNLAVSSFPSGASLSLALGDTLTTPTAAGMIAVSSILNFQAVPFTQMLLTNTAQAGVSVQFVLSWVD